MTATKKPRVTAIVDGRDHDLRGVRVTRRHRLELRCACGVRLDRWISSDVTLADGTIVEHFMLTHGEFRKSWDRGAPTFGQFVAGTPLERIFSSPEAIAYRCGTCESEPWIHQRDQLAERVRTAMSAGLDVLREPLNA